MKKEKNIQTLKKTTKLLVEVVFENETYVFIIEEKDVALFESAKEESSDIYFLIENLEFFRVDYLFGKKR